MNYRAFFKVKLVAPVNIHVFFFLEIECNDQVCNTLLWSPLNIFYVSLTIWANITIFHGAYEARKCKKSSKNHIFRKKISKKKFIFKIRFLDVSDHFKSFGTHFWRHFFEKFHCKFLFVQSDARACSCLSFFEIECNDYI